MCHVKGLYVWRMKCKHINVISLFYIVYPVAINLSFCPLTPAAIWVATSSSCMPLAALLGLRGGVSNGACLTLPVLYEHRELSCFCFRFCVWKRELRLTKGKPSGLDTSSEFRLREAGGNESHSHSEHPLTQPVNGVQTQPQRRCALPANVYSIIPCSTCALLLKLQMDFK